MKKTTFIIAVVLAVGTTGFSQGFLKQGQELLKTGGGLTSAGFSKEEAAKAIKESLSNGATYATNTVSKDGGYFKSPEIKIPFPKEAKAAEDKLRAIGAGKQVDEAILSINQAAELAAKEAKPILVDAIKQLSITDAINIVKGEEDACTQYLDRTTNAALYNKFKPVIQSALQKTGATQHWSTVITKYNKVPFVQKINPDLEDHVTKKAIYGLFVMIAKEEKKIRENPQARTTDLLKKVFGG